MTILRSSMKNPTIAIFFRWALACCCTFSWVATEARPPELTADVIAEKTREIMKTHASHRELSPVIVKRLLRNYLEELDPSKSYFIADDIQQWLEPTDQLVSEILTQYSAQDFSLFFTIHREMLTAIDRRHEIENQIDPDRMSEKVNPSDFKDLEWATNAEELLDRLTKIRALQIETATKLNEELKEKSLQRISKRQTKYEENLQNSDPQHRERLIFSNILKATASALDSHTAYFTPEEAEQFMIMVQQRLFGIGAQLRDDINGFTIVKIVEGGPAADSELKNKDRIIAVDGEPVVGMDIIDAVALIRGAENTPLTLTVIREEGEDDKEQVETKLDITLNRGEVVLKESRFDSSYEPFGDGVIAYLRLYSFYQDPESSSAIDLSREIEKLKEDHRVKGIILDLRYNSGGMLSQAVAVTGLFITKGIVVSIKDNADHIQHLRDLDGKTAWDGPLIVLVNRASASASEIVAQTLQDYGKAIIVGDDHTYGKGSFQTFTLNTTDEGNLNPQGEYKVTRGRYYTVSGKSPQLNGVASNIILPGALSEFDIGERYTKFPLETDEIPSNFDDNLSDIPFSQREKIRLLYKFNLQPKMSTYLPYLEKLQKNSSYRIESNKNYQSFLKELKKKDPTDEGEEENFGSNDLQLTEAYNIMKDLILLMQ